MEKEGSSYSHDSDQDYEQFQIKREISPFDDQSNDESHSNDDDYNGRINEQKNSSSIGRPRILPPPDVEVNSSHNDYDDLGNGSTVNDNQTRVIVMMNTTTSNAKKRPRILAPPRFNSSSGTDEDDNGENVGGDNHNGCIVNFQTRRGRKISRDANGNPLPRNRFLVRINDDRSRSRSVSPARRQVIVDRPLDYVRYSRKCRNYEELGYCLVGDNCPYSHGQNTIVVDDVSHNAMNPSFSAPPPLLPSAKRRPSCSLLIRKIPPGCANIAKINDYFGRFGSVQHIQVSFGGRADEALIRYTDVESAVRAYRCQEPIFCNRFVNLRWWHDEDVEPTAQPQPQHAFDGTFSVAPPTPSSTTAAAAIPSQYKKDSTIFVQSRNFSKTYGSTAAGRSVTFAPSHQSPPIYSVDGAGTNVTVSSRTSTQPLFDDGINTTAAAVGDLVQSAERSRDFTALRPQSKRFATRTERSLELKTEQERLLGAKTDLYLKLSEQVRIVLLNAKAAADSTTRQRWLKMVGELQANMHELGESIRQLYASVYPGRRALDVGAIVGQTGGGTQAV